MGTPSTVRPHVIIAPMQNGRIRCYVRSDHAADVYYRVEGSYGWLTCTCPVWAQHKACKHLAVAAMRAM
jgi:uncharacterized Zn finger protein